MSDKTYRFYLKDDTGKYYSVQNGDVVVGSIKAPLKYAPDGWDGIELSSVRDETWWGIFTKYAIGLRFVMDGSAILKSVYFSTGFLAKTTFSVEKLNTTTMSYNSYFDCYVDYSSIAIEKDFVTVNMEDKGLSQILTTNKNVEYDLNLSQPGLLSGITLDGITIDASIKWTPICYIPFSSIGVANLTRLSRTSELGKAYIPDDIEQYSNAANSSFSAPSIINHYFFKATIAGIIHVDVSNFLLDGSQSGLTTCSLYIRHHSPLGTSQIYNIRDFLGAYVPPFDVSNWQMDINVLPGDTLTLEMGNPTSIPTPGNSTYYSISDISDTQKAEFTLNYIFKYPGTEAYGVRYHEFLSLFLSKMTNGVGILKSDFLTDTDISNAFRTANYDNSPYNTFVLPSDGIRYNITSHEVHAKTTLSAIAKDLFSRWGCGIGVEGNNIVVEPLSYFLNKNKELISIDGRHVSSVSVKPFSEQFFNQIKIGYGSYTYDQLSGTEEFNTGQTYLIEEMPTSGAKENDLISAFRADMFGIEWLRGEKNPDATDNQYIVTSDSDSDNDIFLIEVDPVIVGSFYVPYQPTGTVTGLDNVGQAYNITLSPKRELLRIAPFIKSMIPNGTLKFQATDKNPDLVSSFFSGTITESADLNLATLSTSKLFGWNVLEVVAAPPYNLAEIIADDQTGYVSFEYGGLTFKGFILDIGCTPATRDKYTFKLLSHPDNDLSKLM